MNKTGRDQKLVLGEYEFASNSIGIDVTSSSSSQRLIVKEEGIVIDFVFWAQEL